MRIGIVGAGNISGIYCENLRRFGELEVIGICDIDMAKAQAQGAKHGIDAIEASSLFDRSDLLVLLTQPQSHAELAIAAISAGKRVYSEKPAAISRAELGSLISLVGENPKSLGGAPDTFFGDAHQLSRRILDEGLIGSPVTIHGAMICPGHEHWHPNPAFYYAEGGGPLLDMGPYYLAAMVNLLGPVRSVYCSSITPRNSRVVSSMPLAGQQISIKTPTTLVSQLEFCGGTIGTLTTTFDSYASVGQPHLVLQGTEGVLEIPDPNGYSGCVVLKRGFGEPEVIEISGRLSKDARGVGVLDMVSGENRTSSGLFLHCADIMVSALESAESGRPMEVATTCERPAPVTDTDLVGVE
jgi:predicted dehydrogenase